MFEQAHAALVEGEPRRALEALLAIWRERPAVELAEAIERVGAFAARGAHPPGGTDAADREATWLAEAERADPVMRQRLVETITDTASPVAKVARLVALAEAAGPDPRIAMAGVALATTPRMPYTRGFSTVWNPLFRMLARSGDPRVREAIATAPWDQLLEPLTRLQRTAFCERLDKFEAQLSAAFEVPRFLLPAEHAPLLAEIVRLASAPPVTDERDRETEAALVAAVYATPGDLGPRAIYADWLQERGDPRGEFIALQLANPDPRQTPYEIQHRYRELLVQHRVKWLGVLEQHVRHNEVWSAGFPAEATLQRTGADFATPPLAAWSTIKKITGGIPATDALPMPVLQHAYELDHRGLRTLAKLAKPPPLTVLAWKSIHGDSKGTPLADFESLVHRLPTLRTFHIRGDGSEALAWAWRGTSIRRLVVEAPSERLAYWLAAAVDHQLEHIHISHDNWDTILGTDGVFTAKQFGSGNFERVQPLIEAALDHPSVAARVTSVIVTVYAKHEWKVPTRRRMAALLARHPKWAASAKIYGYVPPA